MRCDYNVQEMDEESSELSLSLLAGVYLCSRMKVLAHKCLQLFTARAFGRSDRHGVTEWNTLWNTVCIIHVQKLIIAQFVEPCVDIYGIIMPNQNVVQNHSGINHLQNILETGRVIVQAHADLTQVPKTTFSVCVNTVWLIQPPSNNMSVIGSVDLLR